MMWSNRAFGIYMGEVMVDERDAAQERDVMIQAIAREHAIERAAACAPEAFADTATWAETRRSARAGRTVAGAARS